jgi:gas vesicle protein
LKPPELFVFGSKFLTHNKMFNQNASADTKIAVLEERLSAYEVMMNKIDEAIQLMGKTSQNISKMLAVHEEKIDQCSKTDDLISKMITDLKEESKEHCEAVNTRIEKIEVRLDEFVKYRWIIVGIFAVVSFAVSQSGMVVDILTPDNQPNYKIETKR